MATRKKQTTPTLAGTVLRDYRKERKATQEQLAEELGIDPRTLRLYESGARPLDSISELRRIADLLAIDPQRLGLAVATEIPRAPAHIEEVVERVWRLIDDSRIVEARAIIEQMLPTLQRRVVDSASDPSLLRSLARTYHAAGYVVAVTTRSFESYKAIPHYREMELIARELGDDTLLNVALTYQGDMYTRSGDARQGIVYLEAARDTTPHADIAAVGNGIQLLGRAYLKIGDVSGFERAMAQAGEATTHFEPMSAVTRGHYNLGTVLEEEGRGYAQSGHMEKALIALDQAKVALPSTLFWEQVVETARALAFVQGGEVRAGADLAATLAASCYETGNIRMLDRIYMIQQHIDRMARDLSYVSGQLRDALDGGREVGF